MLRAEVPAAAAAHAVPPGAAAGHGRPEKAGDERVVSKQTGGQRQLALDPSMRSINRPTPTPFPFCCTSAVPFLCVGQLASRLALNSPDRATVLT